MNYRFTLPFKVRDYECDLQGIVNNSVYQNYLEHTRHEFLLTCQLDFAELTRQGIYLVVTRMELDFRNSLRSGDEFWVGLNLSRRGPVRFEFQQDIYRSRDECLMLNALVIWAVTDAKGRPMRPKQVDGFLDRLGLD